MSVKKADMKFDKLEASHVTKTHNGFYTNSNLFTCSIFVRRRKYLQLLISFSQFRELVCTFLHVTTIYSF